MKLTGNQPIENGFATSTKALDLASGCQFDSGMLWVFGSGIDSIDIYIYMSICIDIVISVEVYSRKILTAENSSLQWLTRQQVEDLAFHDARQM